MHRLGLDAKAEVADVFGCCGQLLARMQAARADLDAAAAKITEEERRRAAAAEREQVPACRPLLGLGHSFARVPAHSFARVPAHHLPTCRSIHLPACRLTAAAGRCDEALQQLLIWRASVPCRRWPS